jgi:hypothetical protein
MLYDVSVIILLSRPMTNPMPNINKRRTVLQVWQIWLANIQSIQHGSEC